MDQALVCLDAPSLLYGIGREFLSNQDTRKLLYQNKKAGISAFALTLHSSFSTVLPEILEKKHHRRRRGQRPSSSLRQDLQILVLQ
jgi:hypothetical protein